MCPTLRTSVHLAILACLLFATPAAPITFTEVPTEIPGVRLGHLQWVDYDVDGDLDLFVMGYPESGDAITRLYRNVDGVFVDATAGLAGLGLGKAAWGDLDGDGDPDLAYAGVPSSDILDTRIYRNDGGTFVDMSNGLLPNYLGPVGFHDPDQDGDVDLLVTGATGRALYLNRDGIFTPIETSSVGTKAGDMLLDDFNADGIADLVRVGIVSGVSNAIYEFILELGQGDLSSTSVLAIPGIYSGSLDWGDYDGDGDLDLASQGRNGASVALTRIYDQSNGNFTPTPLPGCYDGDIAWADADNDGDLDLVYGGLQGAVAKTFVYENNNGTLQFDQELAPMTNASYAWGDYDGDGDLDLAMTGRDVDSAPYFKLYRNTTFLLNNPPTPPSGLAIAAAADEVVLTWNPGGDLETPPAALTYNLRVGNLPGAGDVMSPTAAADGTRYLTGLGNASNAMTIRLRPNNLSGGTVHWGVQSIDAAGGTSAFEEGPSIFLPFNLTTGIKDLGLWSQAHVAWGDYDDDGAQECVISGSVGIMTASFLIPDPANPTFTNFDEYAGQMRWGDYDNDNDLDLLQVVQFSELPARLYRNDGGAFVPVLGSGLPDNVGDYSEWADVDHDGDLDVVFEYGGIYLNDNGLFSPLAGIEAPAGGYISCADFDRDGDMDILAGGLFPGDLKEHRLLRNDGGTWSDITGGIAADIPALGAFIDHDGDGDLDIVVAAEGVAPAIYRNDDGVLVPDAAASAGLPLISVGSILPADVDNDGDEDLLFTGYLDVLDETTLMENNGGTFSLATIGLPRHESSGAYGDLDGDHDLDLFLLGKDTSVDRPAGIYRNNHDNNQSPLPPSGYTALVVDGVLTLYWTAGFDFETPAPQLTYNVRIGTTPGGCEIATAMAHPDGRRKLSAPGNAGRTYNYPLDLAPISADVVYWSVQTLDGAYAGSSFIPEQTVALGTSASPDAPITPAGIASISPNPTAAETSIAFALPRATDARVRIFDVRGRQVRVLRAGQVAAGPHQLRWDGCDEGGRHVGSGTYLMRLEADGVVETRKVVMQR